MISPKLNCVLLIIILFTIVRHHNRRTQHLLSNLQAWLVLNEAEIQRRFFTIILVTGQKLLNFCGAAIITASTPQAPTSEAEIDTLHCESQPAAFP